MLNTMDKIEVEKIIAPFLAEWKNVNVIVVQSEDDIPEEFLSKNKENGMLGGKHE